MPTSITGRSTETGFTLVELLVALVLISLLVALVMPNLPVGQERKLESVAGRLNAMTRLLHDEASLAGVPIYLDFDLDRRRCQAWLIKEGSERETRNEKGWFLQLPDGVRVTRLERLGRSGLQTRQTRIRFFPEGVADETRIWLADERNEASWTLVPLTGALKADETAQP